MHFYVHWSILIIRKKDVSWNLSEKETTGFSRSPKGQKNENWKLSELTKWGVLLNKQVEISRNLKNYPNSINIDHAMTKNVQTGSVHITSVIFIRFSLKNFQKSSFEFFFTLTSFFRCILFYLLKTGSSEKWKNNNYYLKKLMRFLLCFKIVINVMKYYASFAS